MVARLHQRDGGRVAVLGLAADVAHRLVQQDGHLLRLLALGAQALAICFINAYANPANEQTALHAALSVWPNDNVECSSRILPEIREFERTSTTVLNAYLQPVVDGLRG